MVTVSEPIEHSVVVRGPHEVGNSSAYIVTGPDLIEHSGVRGNVDLPSASQLILNSEISRSWEQDRMCDDNTPRDGRKEDQQLSPEEEEAIVVGAVGSAAPWFLTGWADEVEIEFMNDMGCQVTILAASVFECMCASEPQVRAWLHPCGRRLVSADSFPLSVKGEIELTIVFLGLSCDMLSSALIDCWVRKPCSRVCHINWICELWAEGRSTLQLHQQRLDHDVKVFLQTSVLLPPDSEIIAPVSVRSPSGIRPGSCSLVEPSGKVMEDYGVVVGRTLVDASSWSASVLMINPNAEEIILPSFACVGDLVPVSAVSVALADMALPGEECGTLLDHLEDIVTGSHPSLGEAGRSLLRNLLHRYEHVFPAPGEPVTGRTTSVQHEILTSDARPV